MPCVHSITAPNSSCTVKTGNFSVPSWKKIPSLVKSEYQIYLLDKLALRLSPSPYKSHPPDEWWQWIWNNLKRTVAHQAQGGEDLVVLPPASPQTDEKFLQPQSFHQSHEQCCCCWRRGTCGRDIFISSSLPSLSIQNKLELVGKMVHEVKRIPWLALRATTGYVDRCHCSGTAASALASQLSATSQTKPANLLLDF